MKKPTPKQQKKQILTFSQAHTPLHQIKGRGRKGRTSPTLFNQTLCGRLDIRKITATTVKLIDKVIDFIGLEIEL